MEKLNEKPQLNFYVVNVRTGVSQIWGTTKSECVNWLEEEVEQAIDNNIPYDYIEGQEYKDGNNHYMIKQE